MDFFSNQSMGDQSLMNLNSKIIGSLVGEDNKPEVIIIETEKPKQDDSTVR